VEAEERSNLISHIYSRESICAAGAALIIRLAIAGAALVLPLHSALAQFIEQGPKLIGSGGSASHQGDSVALSADGNTAIVGGIVDNGVTGAVWVFTRSGGVWSQQGLKLVGMGAVGTAMQGTSLSQDGNTAIVGGPGDSNNGAAWVYTRSPSGWSQQGAKLTGDAGSLFGGSVALSADGNIALVGEPDYNSQSGAVAVFGRSGGVWTLQNALIGNGAGAAAQQGAAVALSADGRTALVGGLAAGAAWVFIRTGANSWFQQGDKLVGSGAIGLPEQGFSVALSADGNTAIVGGPQDNSLIGAAWVFTRSGAAWTQLGAKLVGAGNSGGAREGHAVALSGDGQTAILGGPNDNSNTGAAWVFVRSRAGTHDFSGDGKSDIVWQDASGNTAVWLMNGAGIASAGSFAIPGWSLVGQRDFNADGNSDMLWRDGSGNTYVWLMNGTAATSALYIGNISGWSVVAVGSFAGAGTGGLVWKDANSNYVLWLMNPSQPNTVTSVASLGTLPGWQIAGTGDFNGDGFADLLWRDTAGDTYIWFMKGTTVLSAGSIGTVPPPWSVVGTGDFNGDGMTDIVWNDGAGHTSVWLMSSTSILSTGNFYLPGWSIAQTGDYNGDGMSDLLWRDAAGDTYIWFMNGAAIASVGFVATVPSPWAVQSVNAE
jgi:hypothetical protein